MVSKVRKLSKTKPITTPFGKIWELTTKKDSSSVNMALFSFGDDKKHYHKKATEIYFILEGSGKIELNNSIKHINAGTVILIEPLTRHKIKSRKGNLKFICTSSPSYNQKDVFYEVVQ